MLGILSEFHPLPSASVKARTKKKSRTKSTARETERPKPTSLAKRQRASSSRRLRLPLVLLQKHIKRGFQGFNRVVFVREFVQTEQTDPDCKSRKCQSLVKCMSKQSWSSGRSGGRNVFIGKAPHRNVKLLGGSLIINGTPAAI